ncbi:MAG: hypothetical protein KIT27_11640 [Legionellales bacterium]|nr:hypothetical protein [Legionellales bacterium]
MKTIIDILFGLGLFINALLFVPQLLRIVRVKSGHDISLLTFAGFFILNLISSIYGYYHSDWIMVIGYAVSALMCVLIVLATLIYRRGGDNTAEKVKK